MIYSPLRYPGGKARLYPYFVELIKENNLVGAEYCEPYAGGAGLALQLLSNGFVANVSINDIDRSVYAFWRSVLFNTESFCSLIEKTEVTIQEWHKQKEIWNGGAKANILSLGFATYFLNRTNRSGIIDGAGPIGGYEQSGKWKLDVRLVKNKQIHNIKSIAKYSNQIKVTNLDAVDFFTKVARNKRSLIYLDPPYFVKGRKLYKNFYCSDDHFKIAKMLARRRNIKWVVSYDDVPEIRKAYKEFKPTHYSLNYSAGDKGVGSEVIFLSDALSPPRSFTFRLAS